MANFAIQKEVLAKNVTRVMEELEKQGVKHGKEIKKLEDKIEKQGERIEKQGEKQGEEMKKQGEAVEYITNFLPKSKLMAHLLMLKGMYMK